MKYLNQLFACIIISVTMQACRGGSYSLDIDSNYKGWIYMIKSTDKPSSKVLRPDEKGVVYIPEKIFDDADLLKITLDGKKPPDIMFRVQFVKFSPGNNDLITYSEFYSPATTEEVSHPVYDFDETQMIEFEYLYASGWIDHKRLVIGDARHF